MFNQLYELLADGGTRSAKELSETLNIRESTLNAGIEYLIRLGFISTIPSCSQTACSSCSKNCTGYQSGRRPKVYQLNR